MELEIVSLITEETLTMSMFIYTLGRVTQNTSKNHSLVYDFA